MKKRYAAGLTGVLLAGAMMIGQAAPSVFAKEGQTSLAVSETEEAAEETEEKAATPRARAFRRRSALTSFIR